ncbi:hypothetical protein BH23VER1_BH23VER1_09290 [soil metagenome]
MHPKLSSKPDFPFHAAVLLGAVAGFTASAPAEGEVGVTKIAFAGSELAIEFRSNRECYYLLDELNAAFKRTGSLELRLGEDSLTEMRDPNPRPGSGFYRVREFPIEVPQDIDGDGIDDIYELEKEGLDPLNPSDAATDIRLDGETMTELVAYENNYSVGRGRADITAQAAQGAMMGYADSEQKTTGIHDRQWARAFIIRDRKPPHRRVVHVVVDNGQVFQSITQGVQDKIRDDSELSPYYCFENIVLSATHTHGGGGGHSHFALYHAATGGYSWRNYDAMVHGIYLAIKRAHRDLEPGGILRNRGQLYNANENRRPRSFEQNVEHDYPEILGNPFGTDNRDTEMVLLRFDHQNGGPVGMLNWFPVHGVSVSKLNTLLTGDNKGNAAYLSEKQRGAIYPGFPGYSSSNSTFVAAFANSNPGDMTANRRTLEVPWPAEGVDDYGRAEKTGGRQHQLAKALFDGDDGPIALTEPLVVVGEAGVPARVTGSIDYRHEFVDMNSVSVDPPNLYPYNVPGVGFPGSSINPPWHTCQGALGVEFARGTLDGEALDQATVNFLIGIGGSNSDGCQAPKDVLLTTAAAVGSTGLTPHWMPISILKVGDVAILAVPAEFTVMAGWRLRKTVEQAFAKHGVRVRAVLSGLSNSYSGYVTTYEEYVYEEVVQGTLNQSYEAASTHFGAFTLAAYQTRFSVLAESIATGADEPSSPSSVSMPSSVIPDEPIVFPTDKIAFLDTSPPDKVVAATYHEDAGCPTGQFNDLFTGDCWSCPDGYVRTVIPITQITDSNACVRPAFSTFEAATQHGSPGCDTGAGEFFDLLTGDCWSCPSGYNRTVFSITGGSACERPAYPVYTSSQSTSASGGTDCPSGYVYDFIIGRCFRCPTNYAKNVFRAWDASNACERSLYETTSANYGGQGYGIFGTDCDSGYVWNSANGGCYRCPSGYAKNIFRSWTANDACERTRVVTTSALSATATGGTDCPPGYVYDFILGSCYKCPDNYAKYVFAVWNANNACERFIPTSYSSATNHGDGICGPGEFLDIGLGTCWSCPAGTARTVLFPVNGPSACERVHPAVYDSATRHGKFACENRNSNWFLDIGLQECWSCPSGAWRNLNPVNGGAACNIPQVFGNVKSAPSGNYIKGQTLSLSFWGGHPGNTFGTFSDNLTNAISTFFQIERWTGLEWQTVRTDADWDTTFEWRAIDLSGESIVKWVIPSEADSGTYRVLHRGYAGDLFGVESYSGYSPQFSISN